MGNVKARRQTVSVGRPSQAAAGELPAEAAGAAETALPAAAGERERGTVEEPPDLAFSPRLQKYGFETRPRPRKKENPLSRFLLLVNKSKPVRNSDTGVLTHSAQQKVVTHP